MGGMGIILILSDLRLVPLNILTKNNFQRVISLSAIDNLIGLMQSVHYWIGFQNVVYIFSSCK